MVKKTLAELRRENARLKSRNMGISKFNRRQSELKELRRENSRLKYPGAFKAGDQIKRAGLSTFMRLGEGTGNVIKKQLDLGYKESKKSKKRGKKR